MPASVLFTIKLFADNILLYRKITNPRYCALLQQGHDRLQEWEKKRQMAFNADKCEVFRLTYNEQGSPFLQDYFIMARS